MLDPRRIAVSLPRRCRGCGSCSARWTQVDLAAPAGRTTATPRAGAARSAYDRLMLAAGSVNKLLPMPGVAEHAHGFRGLPEALYLRDHIDPPVRAGRRDRRPGRAGGAADVRGGRRRLHRHRGGRARACCSPTRCCAAIRGCAGAPAALDAAGHRRAGAARAGRSGCPPPRTGCCAERGVEVRTGVRRSRRPPPTGCGSPTGACARPGRWSGASACGRTRWWTRLGLPHRAGPAGRRRVPDRTGAARRCTRAATRPRCPT